jgi:hypothetical protein
VKSVQSVVAFPWLRIDAPRPLAATIRSSAVSRSQCQRTTLPAPNIPYCYGMRKTVSEGISIIVRFASTLSALVVRSNMYYLNGSSSARCSSIFYEGSPLDGFGLSQ